MNTSPNRAKTLDNIELGKGNHSDPNHGLCLMEAVAWIAGEPHTDRPSCASPILGAFGRSLNDVLPHAKRQHLVPLVPKIVGTAGDGHDQQRGLMAADWLIRTYTPAWLRLAGLEESAISLETLPRQATWDDVAAAVPVVRETRRQAAAAGEAAWDAAGAARAAARDAAWEAAGAAAWEAAREAARAAAREAAWEAAWDAARAAARDAARAAARDAARAAAREAAREAARAAAREAAREAAGEAAREAARAAARAALQPTTDTLQDSAIDLYTHMVTVTA